MNTIDFKPQYKIVLIYLLAGVIWIFFSDLVVDSIFVEKADLSYAQNIKGWLFVAVTAILLFFLIKKDVSEISDLNVSLVSSYDQTINGWVKILDVRHQETKDHTMRVTAMALALAKLAGISDKHKLEHIRRGAILHDIGKIGVPDEILVKPGKLSEKEWELMRAHPQIAYDLLLDISFLMPSIAIPYCHHEKWDGSGYPQCLRANAIPIEARIFSIVDVWDALIHPRVYKSAWAEEEVLNHIQEQAGKHFDPEITKIFMDNYEEIKLHAMPVTYTRIR